VWKLLIALAIVSPLVGLAQESPTNAAVINATAQLVDISRFRASHPTFSIVVQDHNIPSDALNGQIPQYGGPLQYFVNTRSLYPLHDLITPFGASAAVPMAHGRIELLGSAGGLFEPIATAYTRPNAWVTQATFGARFALDQAHHFWVGGNARYVTDFADKKRQFGLLTADFTFQSGH
jgi:hypothetical protein